MKEGGCEVRTEMYNEGVEVCIGGMSAFFFALDK